MKSLNFFVLLILLVTLIATLIPTESEAEIYTDTVRLHILASSDTEKDQEIKLSVRDFVLENFGTRLSGFDNIENAKLNTEKMLPEIENSVNAYLTELGVDYGARVTLGKEWYDTRDYGDFTLPRGIYCSLQILLGSCEGKNWWCVMYPPMCLDLALENAPSDDGIIDYTKEEAILITSGKYSVKFKLLELVSDAMREISKNG